MEDNNKESKGNKIFKKGIKFLAIALLILVLGGIGGVATERYVFPKLSSYDFFSKFDFIKKTNENVTVINKTEKVMVQEEDSINKIASQAETTVVNIISVPDNTSSIESASQNGTGVIVTGDGYVVTYRDAILETDASYKILTFDGVVHDAQLVGVDNYSNLAFLKMDGSNFPVIAFSNSDDFRPGKKMIAIGNAFEEYQNRYSAGLLSNLNKTFNLSGKTVSSSEKLEGVFEVDFDNQEEYLGGPIIDYNGDLVGIIGKVELDNKNKYFQIPANSVKSAMTIALEENLDKRAQLGVYYNTISKSYAVAYELEMEKGALIFSPSQRQGLAVMYNSPAWKAGMQVGDIVLAVNGSEVNLDNPLSEYVSEMQKGEKANLKIMRNGEEMEIEVEF